MIHASPSPFAAPPAGPTSVPMEAAVTRLLRRMRDDGLSLRADPTRSDACMLVRRGRGPSLGAGQIPRAVVEAAITAGHLVAEHGGWVLAGAATRVAPESDGGAERPRVNLRESPLQWLARRRDADGAPFLSAAAVLAGERLRADATEAAMLPSVTVNWSRMEQTTARAMPRDPAMASERVIAARQRVRAAHRALGSGLGGFTLDVCAFLVPLQAAEGARGWPARSGKVILRLALDQLADHYGIATEARGADRAAIHGWRDGERAGMAGWL